MVVLNLMIVQLGWWNKVSTPCAVLRSVGIEGVVFVIAYRLLLGIVEARILLLMVLGSGVEGAVVEGEAAMVLDAWSCRSCISSL